MAFCYFIGLNVADALLTGVAIALGAIEVNPVLSLFSVQLGLPKAMFVKTLFALSLGGVVWQRRKLRVLKVLNYIMLGIVISNMLIMSYAL